MPNLLPNAKTFYSFFVPYTLKGKVVFLALQCFFHLLYIDRQEEKWLFIFLYMPLLTLILS